MDIEVISEENDDPPPPVDDFSELEVIVIADFLDLDQRNKLYLRQCESLEDEDLIVDYFWFNKINCVDYDDLLGINFFRKNNLLEKEGPELKCFDYVDFLIFYNLGIISLTGYSFVGNLDQDEDFYLLPAFLAYIAKIN